MYAVITISESEAHKLIEGIKEYNIELEQETSNQWITPHFDDEEEFCEFMDDITEYIDMARIEDYEYELKED